MQETIVQIRHVHGDQIVPLLNEIFRDSEWKITANPIPKDDAAPSEARDHFAALAMQGLLAGRHPGTLHTDEQLAEQSYRIADAMLCLKGC